MAETDSEYDFGEYQYDVSAKPNRAETAKRGCDNVLNNHYFSFRKMTGMNMNKSNWTNHPSTNQVVFITIVWVINFILLVTILTDFFSTSPSFKQNPPLVFFFLIGTVGLIRIHKNYRAQKKA